METLEEKEERKREEIANEYYRRTKKLTGSPVESDFKLKTSPLPNLPPGMCIPVLSEKEQATINTQENLKSEQGLSDIELLRKQMREMIDRM